MPERKEGAEYSRQGEALYLVGKQMAVWDGRLSRQGDTVRWRLTLTKAENNDRDRIESTVWREGRNGAVGSRNTEIH